MKNLLTVFLFTLTVAFSFSQTETSSSCYEQWAKVFDARGAYEVPDGDHDGIIIAIRRTNGTYDCFLGRATVAKNAVIKMYRQLEDDSFEIFEPQAKYPKTAKQDIVAGITSALQTVDSEVIYIIFVNHLKPKKMDYKTAPLPNPDDF